MKFKTVFVYFALLALLLGVVACGSGDEPTAEGETAVSTSSESENVDSGMAEGETGEGETAVSDSPSTTNEQPATSEESSAETSFIENSFFAQPSETLDSYRMVTEIQFVSSEEAMGMEEPMLMEYSWVANPPAEHTITSGILGDANMETIVIGNQTWVTMGDGTWIESTNSEQNPAEMQGMMTGIEDMLADIQNSMVPVGSAKANGFNCQKYEVDANFTMEMPFPEDEEGSEFMPTGIVGHITGEIWIADESDLPPVIIRSYTTQSITMQLDAGEGEAMVYEEKRDLYDVNLPITIEPPEGAIVNPNPVGNTTETLANEAPAAGNAPDVEIGELESLDSFRIEWTVMAQMGEDEGAMSMSNLVEYVKEPYAVRVDLGMGEQSMGQFVLVGDQAWVKMGNNWMSTSPEDVVDTYADIAEVMLLQDDAVYMGEAVVDGINCLHYIYDFQGMIHQEWWVANESDLPAIVIKTDYQMNMEGMNTQTLGRVYDINTPITIEPPQS